MAPSVATVHTRCALMGPTVHNGVTSHYPLYHTVTEGPQDGHVTVSYMGMYCTYHGWSSMAHSLLADTSRWARSNELFPGDITAVSC